MHARGVCKLTTWLALTPSRSHIQQTQIVAKQVSRTENIAEYLVTLVHACMNSFMVR